METWKAVQEFEGRIEVSTSGLIISLGNGASKNPVFSRPRLLNQRISSNGYLRVKICFNGNYYHRLMHRLVAKTFIENPENKREVNHIDGNKTNNRISNLEWVTSSENQKHAFKTGLQISRKGADSKFSIKILQKTLAGEFVKEWDSINSVKKELGFNNLGIIGCCKQKPRFKTAYGYKWEYAN